MPAWCAGILIVALFCSTVRSSYGVGVAMCCGVDLALQKNARMTIVFTNHGGVSCDQCIS